MTAPFTALDEFTFHHRLAQTTGSALVLFTGQGCSSCRAWKTLLQQYHHQHPELQLFEVDTGHAQALAREFDVFHLPTLILYCDGIYHGTIQCEANPLSLEQSLRQSLAAPPQEAP